MFIMAGTRIEVVQVEEMDETLTKTVHDPEKTNWKEVQVGKAVDPCQAAAMTGVFYTSHPTYSFLHWIARHLLW